MTSITSLWALFESIPIIRYSPSIYALNTRIYEIY